MAQKCPKCRDVNLEAIDGRANRLLRCSECGGTWFPKDEARLESVAALMANDSTIRPGSVSDAHTGLCPMGHGIMIRTRVDTDPPFYLERCPHCHGIWFDKGEWNVLAEEHLLDHLNELWDPVKKRQLRPPDPPQEVRIAQTVEVRVRRRPPEEELRLQAKEKLGPHLVGQIEALGSVLRRRTPESRREAVDYLLAIVPKD